MLKFRSNGGYGFSLLHLYSTSTEPTLSLVNYLVNSLGFSHQQALSCSSKLYSWNCTAKKVNDFDSISKADSIISFLNQTGFDESHIRNIICYDPRILRAKIDKTLKPKIEFLQNQGLSGPDLVQFVIKNPVVLLRRMNSGTLPAIQALRAVLGDDENVIASIKKMDFNVIARLAKYLVPNVALLQEYGIALDSIRKRIVQQPGPFVRNTKSFKDVLIRVEEKLGIPRDSSMFLYGLHLLGSLREENIVSKCQVFRSFGWTESDIRELIRKNPNCLALSETRIKKSLEFFMNELGYKPDFIRSHHALLICSLEKRIIPRHRVLLVLKDKGLVDHSLYSVAIYSEALFMKRFVLPFKEVHGIYAECTGRPVPPLTPGTAATHSFVSYLVDSLGFSKQQALSCSSKLYSWQRIGEGAKKINDFKFIQRAESIISFLKENGFDPSHIRNIVNYDPRILRAKIEKTLKPKIEFLRDQGFSGLDLVQFVSKNPLVLTKSLNGSTLPALQALRAVLGNNENLIFHSQRLDHNLLSGLAKYLVANVTLLQSYGIPLESIQKRIIQQPWPFVRNTKLFKELLIRVEERWGIPRDSSMFLYGIHMLGSFSEETFVSKCQVFKSFGWSELDVREFVKRNPNCLAFSEARIRKSLDFFMNELGYTPDFITSHPSLLISSLEKRIIPRHRILLVLKDKALIRRNHSLYSVAILSEALFMKRFVLPFKEVHEVYAECTGRPVPLLSPAKEDSHPQS